MSFVHTVKPVLSGHSEDPKNWFLVPIGLMEVKSIEGEHSAILSTAIKLPFSIKTLVLSIFKWPLKTGFTVHVIGTDTHLLHTGVLIRFFKKETYKELCALRGYFGPL